MSRLMHKSVRIGKYTIPALLLLALAIGSVVAVAYVVLTSTMTATVVPNPKVCFVQWPATKANTFSYGFNIFADIQTIDDNVTHGIWNWDTGAHDISLRVSDITNEGTNIASFKVKVYNASTTIAEITSVGTSWSGPYSIPGLTKYTIGINVTATGSPSGSSVFTVDMKVENP